MHILKSAIMFFAHFPPENKTLNQKSLLNQICYFEAVEAKPAKDLEIIFLVKPYFCFCFAKICKLLQKYS